MGNCSSCSSNGKCSEAQKQSCNIITNDKSKINSIVAIMSGKGGVGKSSVTSLLANALANKGYKVGILDADITGPSIPRLMGVASQQMQSDGEAMLPVISQNGVKVVSLNLIIEKEDSPVVWRGPIITNTVLQFYKDVLWGELDYLLIDMPPGTGDVALTVMQSLPISSIIMVTIPQTMVSMIVGKAIHMASKLGVKLLGVVENMSYLNCPCCNEKIALFGSENSQSYLDSLGVKLLATLPMDTKFCSFGSAGIFSTQESIMSEFDGVVQALIAK